MTIKEEITAQLDRLNDDQLQYLQTIIQTLMEPDGVGSELDRLEALPPDPNQPTIEELSTLVKQVRQELWT